MRVYRIQGDVNAFQQLQLDKELSYDEFRKIIFDGKPKGAAWDPPPVYSPYPSLPEPDIWWFNLAMTFPPALVDQLESLLYRSGEMLPLPYRGETWQVLNVTPLTDCLDPDQTVWEEVDGRRLRPSRPAFFKHRLPDTLFKLPELSTSIFCAEGRFDREEEFKATVEDLDLQGLLFIPIWDESLIVRGPADWGVCG